MCNIVKANRGIGKEVTIDDIEKIAQNLKKIGVGIILLTGGEPFVRRDLPEIIRILKSNGLSVRLQTSGLMTTPEQLHECVAVGGFDINVSLDTLDSEKQNYIDGVDRSWQRSVETIANISQIFPNREGICAIGNVISRMNYNEVIDFVGFANAIGWYSSLVPVHITDSPVGFRFRGRDKSFAFQKEDFPEVDKLFDNLIELKRQGYSIFDSEEYLESCKWFIRTGTPSWRNKKTGVCDSPSLYFAIDPNGDFAVCCDHIYPDKLSVMDEDFPRIYRSKEFRKRVLEITSQCPGCQFGSYPEVTLVTRNWRAFLERGLNVFRPIKKKPYTYEELLKIITVIREGKYAKYRKS